MRSLGRGVGAAAVLLAACVFDTGGDSGAGNSLGSGTPPGGDTEEESASISATRGSNSMSGDSTTGPGEDTENTGDTADVTESDTTNPPQTSGPTNDESAFLTLDSLAFSFPPVALGSSGTLTVEVSNDGMADATALATATLDDPFHYVGGYPGEGGTCGQTIAGGETCTLVLNHAPTRLGRASGSLVLSYHDGTLSRTTAPASVEGDGTGMTENLVLNPSAANGVEHWMPTAPPEWSSVDDPTSSDDGRSFGPADESIQDRHLRQTVDLSGYSDVNATSALRYEFSVHAKSEVPTDDYSVKLQVNGNWSTLMIGDQNTWSNVTAGGTLPLGPLTSITIELTCITPIGLQDCDARFDAVSLRLAYP